MAADAARSELMEAKEGYTYQVVELLGGLNRLDHLVKLGDWLVANVEWT